MLILVQVLALLKKRNTIKELDMVKTELELNGRTVVDAKIDGIDLRDYPDFCDAYFESACYEDGTALTDDELEQLREQNFDAFYEQIIDRIY